MGKEGGRSPRLVFKREKMADPSAITAALTADELGQTVEAYLRGQCEQRVKSLKRHMDERISEFEEGVKQGRQALVEIFKVQPTDSQKLWKIGRDKAADLSLAGDEEVSSAHAQISFDRKQFKLMDLGSTNGTVATVGNNFKGVALKKMRNHILKVNHLVTFGGSTFRWCYFSEAETVVKQAETDAAAKK